jgi:hypothetical protein
VVSFITYPTTRCYNPEHHAQLQGALYFVTLFSSQTVNTSTLQIIARFNSAPFLQRHYAQNTLLTTLTTTNLYLATTTLHRLLNPNDPIPLGSFSSQIFVFSSEYLRQCCPTYLYIGAHLTDGCGGAGAVWRFQ